MKQSIILLVVLSFLTTPVLAATEWLPEDGRESLSVAIAAKLADTALDNEKAESELLDMARAAVSGIIDTIDSWGPEELARRAPELPELGLPASDDPYLAAIARYGACSIHIEALFNNRALDETAPSMRVTAAIAAAAIPLATANLRHHFRAAGGTDDALGAYLTSEEMAAASQRIEGNRELISYSWKECAPTIAGLTETAIPRPEEPVEAPDTE